MSASVRDVRHTGTALVVTTISAPNRVLHALADGAREKGWQFYVIGDRKSPASFELPGSRFLGLSAQTALPFRYAAACPVGHYARKNIGYLLAIRDGADVIVETDDDNLPTPEFFAPRDRRRTGHRLTTAGWVNVYRYFTAAHVWPRGLPLGEITGALTPRDDLTTHEHDCLIHQGLADGSPDVDAIYRLAQGRDIVFDAAADILLMNGAWCPFNSQNTTWFSEVFRLLYLPAHCSFRMTDIWRSFVALSWLQRSGGALAFHKATVFQDRNEHNLERDFLDEVPGYTGNRAIREEIESVPWTASQADFLRHAYARMIARGWVGPQEAALLDAWLADIDAAGLERCP
jgi:hypothetical protein